MTQRVLVFVIALTSLTGCVLDPSAIFAQDFLQAFGATPSAASLPGEAPSLVMGVRNETGSVIEYQISFRNSADEVETSNGVLPAGGPGVVLNFSEFCPVTEVTLGDVSNLSSTGAVVRLGTGLATDPFVEVEPFGVLLQEGVQFDCGDRITFIVSTSGATATGFQVFAEIERADP